jgi:hypothetical protein
LRQSKEGRIADRTDFAKDQRRDAHATIAGFVFQVNSTIREWLELQSNEYLELEAGVPPRDVASNLGVSVPTLYR